MNTPTPWGFDQYGRVCTSVDADGTARFDAAVRVCGVMLSDSDTAKANAALIVRAVNSHQALIDALEHLVRLLAPVEAGELSVPGLATLNEARAALKLAKGEA